MSCESQRDRLVAFLYDELAHGERADFEAHLAACGACRGELERLAEARSLLAGSAGAVPPAPRVMVLSPPLARRRWVGIAASAFLAGVLASTGFFAGMKIGAAQPATAEGPRPADAGGTPSASDLAALRASFDARLAQQRSEIQSLIDRKDVPEVTRNEVAAELAKLERKVDGWRANDVEYLLAQLAAVEKRQSTKLDQTQDALRYVALSRDPRVSEQ
jgi:hypothetical protein